MSEEQETTNDVEEHAMLDVHPPHEAAHNWRDIFIHLATITVGLFIALSLEGCVEWQHHRHLVHEARENIRSEIVDNRKEIQNALKEIHQEQAQVKADITALGSLRKDSKAHASVGLHLTTFSLANASWSTARETGALSFMSYPEVKRYAEIYDKQSEFAGLTARVTGAYTNSFSVLYMFDVDQDATTGIQKNDIDSAIQKVLAVQSELMVYESSAKILDQEYSEALKQQL